MNLFQNLNQGQTNTTSPFSTSNQPQPQTQPQQSQAQQQQPQPTSTTEMEAQQKNINIIQNIYGQIRASSQLMKESVKENLDLNLKSFEYFVQKNSLLATKRIDQLYAITSNFRKQLEKKQVNDTALDLFLSKENINIQRIEKEIAELQNTIQTKYEIPTEQSSSSTQDKFFLFDNYEQSIRLQSNLINSNLSSTALGEMNTTMLSIVKEKMKKTLNKNGNQKGKEGSGMSFGTPRKKQMNDIITGSIYNTVSNALYGSNQQKKKVVQDNNYFAGIPQKGNDDKELFSEYFACLRNYFDYTSGQNFIDETSNTQSQLLISLLSMTNTFCGMRKKLFELLHAQVSLNHNSKVSTGNIVSNTVQYYEHLFYSQLLNNGQNPQEFSSLLKIIEDYSYQNLYSKFSNTIHLNRSDISQWAKLFYFLRCGLIDHCKTYINSIPQKTPELTLFNTIICARNITLEDYQALLNSVNQNDSITNPYKHACLVLISKKNQPLNDNILLDINDYLWFHLKLISHEERYMSLKQNTALYKFLSLEEFQSYILQIPPSSLFSNQSEIAYEYPKCLMSLLMYDKAIDFFCNQNGHLIDATILNFVLIQLNMCHNYKSIDIENINDIDEDNKAALISDQQGEKQFKCSSIINNESIGNLPEAIVLIKYTEKNYQEIIGNMVLQSNDFTIFNGYDKESQLDFNKLFTQNDLIDILKHIAEGYPFLNHHSMPLLKKLLKELRKHRMSKEIINVMIFHQCQFIKAITPRKMLNLSIHQENDRILLIEEIEENKQLFDFWKFDFDEKDFDNKYRNDCIFLRQLEVIPQILLFIENNNELDAYNTFFKWISMIPQSQELTYFLNSVYLQLNTSIQNIYPEICYLSLYLIQLMLSKTIKSNNNYYGRNNNEENQQNNREKMSQLESFCEKMVQLKDNRQNVDKFRYILNIIQDLSTQY